MMESWASARAFAVLRHLKRLKKCWPTAERPVFFSFTRAMVLVEGRGAYDLGGHREGADCQPFTMEAGTTATPTPEAAHIRLVRASSLTQRYSGWGWGTSGRARIPSGGR